MKSLLPEYLKQGEPARLFPVLSNTSKEGRTTSIVLACISKIDEFSNELLSSIGQKVGKTSKIETYTEVVFNKELEDRSRPDGLIVLKVGKRSWSALVEAKVGSAELLEEQIERYRALAKNNKIDAVITISNQFTTEPANHPIRSVRKKRSSIPVYHWSWMYLLTVTDLMTSNASVKDEDQAVLMNELRRFLSHESAGVRGFDRMPSEWVELNKQVASSAPIPAKSENAQIVLEAWHQESKDLSLILTRQTETKVTQRLARKHVNSPSQRLKDEFSVLKEHMQLKSTYDLSDAAAPIDVCADILRRTIEVGMTLRAPEDKVSAVARVNWLLRQIKTEQVANLYFKLHWPGASAPTVFSYDELKANSKIVEEGKEGLKLLSITAFNSYRTGARFAQRNNFITDLEEYVPTFYADVGQHLSAWKKKAPQIKEQKRTASEVSVQAISEDANDDAL